MLVLLVWLDGGLISWMVPRCSHFTRVRCVLGNMTYSDPRDSSQSDAPTCERHQGPSGTGEYTSFPFFLIIYLTKNSTFYIYDRVKLTYTGNLVADGMYIIIPLRCSSYRALFFSGQSGKGIWHSSPFRGVLLNVQHLVLWKIKAPICNIYWFSCYEYSHVADFMLLEWLHSMQGKKGAYRCDIPITQVQGVWIHTTASVKRKVGK